jgi:hypothetical protein
MRVEGWVGAGAGIMPEMRPSPVPRGRHPNRAVVSAAHHRYCESVDAVLLSTSHSAGRRVANHSRATLLSRWRTTPQASQSGRNDLDVHTIGEFD